jgi:hypothetical protein
LAWRLTTGGSVVPGKVILVSRLKSALAFALSTLLVAAPMSLLIPGAAQAAPPATGPGSLDTSFATGGVFRSGNGFSEALDSAVVDPTWNGGTA